MSTADNPEAAFRAAGAHEIPIKGAGVILPILPLEALMDLQIKPRQYAIQPILPFPGLGQIYAPRGLGKTFVALSFSLAIASGGTFMRWRAPEPRRVLHIDGEMPAGELRERAKQLMRAMSAKPREGFLGFSIGDLLEAGIPNIASEAGMEMISRAMEGADVLVLDNLSTLAAGMRENEADDWGPFQTFLLALRRSGKTVLLIHHAGKGGQQRGTSRREDALDTVIALRRPDGYSPEEGARFEVHIEKARGAMGPDVAPFEARLSETAEGGLAWSERAIDNGKREAALAMLADGVSLRNVEKETGIPRSTLGRWQKEAS
jgi:putative DNA primase/helicase